MYSNGRMTFEVIPASLVLVQELQHLLLTGENSKEFPELLTGVPVLMVEEELNKTAIFKLSKLG